MVLKIFARIRYHITYLILFFIIACTANQDREKSISIVWKEDRAIGLIIPRHFFYNIPDNSLKDIVTVHLVKDSNQPAILGENRVLKESVHFEPLIPLTAKYTYEVRVRNSKVGEITIPAPVSASASAVLGIFPTQDTLPLNLLKFYFQFSNPMREGQALKHIFLLNKKDTVPGVFLDLQPELWNQDRTLLTLWLDPGRIKRELQPNKKLGVPLRKGQAYELVVDRKWTDAKGEMLTRTFRKVFFVSERDSLSPVSSLWKIKIPTRDSLQPLRVHFNDHLDYVLAKESIEVLDEEGKNVAGEITIMKEESIYLFAPEAPWKSGVYNLRSESRLEDLAGNNLNRIFDRNISQPSHADNKVYHENKFLIK